MAAFIGGTGTAYPVALTEIGLALETTRGTLMASPSYMIPVKGPKYKPNQTFIPDDTLQGSMVKTYDEIEGMRDDQHGWDSFPYLDSFPVLVCAELGSPDTMTTAMTATTLAASALAGATSVTLTAGGAAGDIIVIGSGAAQETHIIASMAAEVATLTYPLINAQASGATVTGLTSHAFSLLNNGTGQPPSVSLWDNDGEEWRTMTACQIDELTIKGNATGLIDYTTSLFGNPATGNASAPSTSYTTAETPAPWTVQVLLGGTQLVTVEDWEFDFKRGVKPIPALTGTKEYLAYFADVLESTAKLTFVEQSSSPYLDDYENGVKQSLDLTFFDLATGFLANIHSTSAIFTSGQLDRSKEYCTVACDVQLLPTSTDATAGGRSPVKITIGNTVATTYH